MPYQWRVYRLACILASSFQWLYKRFPVDWMVFVGEQWLLITLLVVLIATLLFVESKRSGASLSYHEVTRMINDDNAVVLDVRETKEFNIGHIVDALNIPFVKLKDRMAEFDKHRNKTIIVVDKMGQHATASVKLLTEAGYTSARMQGGMTEWQAQKLPVVKS